MRIFYVGGFEIYENLEYEKRLRSFGVEDRLISYAFLKKKPKYRAVFSKILETKLYEGVMLDSGAFTAAFTEDTIDIEKYIDYCTSNHYDFIIGLDEIPYDPKEGLRAELFDKSARNTYINCNYMVRKGINVIPTFHQGEDFDYLRRYCDEYPIVSLGVSSKRLSALPFQLQHLDTCFNIIPKECKVHGLAITDFKLPLIYPFYSVDSNTWQREARYGKIKIKLFNRFETVGLTRGLSHKKLTEDSYRDLYDEVYIPSKPSFNRHYNTVQQEVRDECDRYLATLGTNVDKCREDIFERYRVNVLYYNELLRGELKLEQKQEVLF